MKSVDESALEKLRCLPAGGAKNIRVHPAGMQANFHYDSSRGSQNCNMETAEISQIVQISSYIMAHQTVLEVR